MTVLHKNFIGGESLNVETGTVSRSIIPLVTPCWRKSPIPQPRWSIAPFRRRRRPRRVGPGCPRSNAPTPCAPSPPKSASTSRIARVITEEQGKILDLARVEVAFTADYLDYMAEWARRIEGEILESDRPGETIFLFRQPIGVIGGILPWNFPFFLIARKAAPALVTGNTIVIKPSEETPHNAVKFCELLAESTLRPG